MDFSAIPAHPLCIVLVINMSLCKHGHGGVVVVMKRVLQRPFGDVEEAWIIILNRVEGKVRF